MGILLLIFIFIADSANGQCITTNLLGEGGNYSMVYNCSQNYTAAYDHCLSSDMQLLYIKTLDEVHFISDNIVTLGYNNSMFWIGGVCPEVLTIPDNEDLCTEMSANVSSEVTTSYFSLTFQCETLNAWICEDTNVSNPCPITTTTTMATPTTTTPTTTTPTTTTPITATPTTATPTTTTPTTTTTNPTTTSTTTSATTTAPASSTYTSTTTTTTTTSTSASTTSTSTTTTATTGTTTKETPPECTESETNSQGSNQYLLFHNCTENPPAASRVCNNHNSSLAVLVSQREIIYLATLIAGLSNGSWSYWVGGLTETGGCVMFTFDQLVTTNTSTRYGISIGQGCEEKHPFICKTFVETVQVKLKRYQSNITQGSVMDHRPSAIFLGSFGIAILVMIFVVVIIIDLPNIVHDLTRARKGLSLYTRKHTVISKTDIKPKSADVETQGISNTK